MVKLGLEIKETNGSINIKLVDPTKKQLDTASENELLIAQKIKDNFENIIKILEKKED